MTTELVPVSLWTWNRYQVTFKKDNSPKALVLHLVSTETHLILEIDEKGEELHMDSWTWELVEEDVPRPKQIGTMYGNRIDVDGWE